MQLLQAFKFLISFNSSSWHLGEEAFVLKTFDLKDLIEWTTQIA